MDAAPVTKVATGTNYSDVPLTGAAPSASALPSTVCSGTSSVLTASLITPNVTIGTGTSTTSATTQPTAFCNRWPSYRMQLLYTGAELQAAGLNPGNIGSMAFNITTPGDAATNSGFTVMIGSTALTVLSGTAFVSTTGFTTVYPSQVYTHTATGLQTIPFSTPYVWDGSSNILVDIVMNGANASNNSVTLYTATAGNTVAYTLTAAANAPSFSTNRLNTVFKNAPTITNVSWSDGTNVVGTNNPQTVNPTNATASAITVTYTATITAAGCTTTASTNVTVNPLPAPPNANNSTQCGIAVPGCFVTTGGGGAGFKWYSAQTGGTLLQNGGATYTSTISATTHFWVSESNGTCESARAEVIAVVASADPIEALVDNNNVCLNTAISLSATQTPINPGTPNNYTYTWTANPVAGSGIPTNVTGNPVSVTPTASGTYTYTVTANDVAAGCTNVSTVVVTVKALPVIASATATASTICSGVSSTLNGSGLPQYFSIPVSGFNFDVVANGTGAGSSSTTADLDNVNTLVASDWNFSGVCTALTNFMPASGTINANSTVAPGLTYILQPYSANNALRIPATATGGGTGSGTVTLTTPTTASKIFLLYIVGNGPITSGVTATVNFTDATTQVFSNLTAVDWFNSPNPAIGNVGRINRATAACQTTTGTAGGPNLHDLALTLSAGNTSKLIQSITVQVTTGTATMAVMGVGGFRTSVPYNWSWNPGSLSGSSVVVSPTSTTTYTVTATDPATTCSNTATVTVTVNPLPPAPSGADGTGQCGTALSDMSVSSNNVTDPQVPAFFKWYDAPTGGVLKQSGTSTTYTTPISTTTTLYVSEVSANGCEGPRTVVTTVVSSPDPVTVNATPASVCVGTPFDLSSSYTPDFNSFATFDLTASGGAASGVTGTVSLTPNATGSDPYTITPTAAGTYTYTVTAFDPDKGCTAISTVEVIVKPLPTIISASASPATICAGASSTLTAVTGSSSLTTVQIGNGSSSVGTGTTNGAFYGTFYGNGRAQILIKASELTALGFLPGNLTSLSIDVSALGTGSVQTLNGFTIKLGNISAATASISTYQSPTFTTVWGPTNYTPVVGNNTHTFIAPYTWDGVSSLIVEYCFTSGGTGTLNSVQHTVTTTAFGSFVNHQVDGSSPSECTTTLITNATSVRPNIKFTGLVGTSGPGAYSWVWNPGNLSGNVQTVTPSATTTYTVTATFNGCSNTAQATVTVNPIPAAPSTNDPVTRCGPGSVTLTATGSGGPLKWYNVASGGTSLFTGGSYTTNVTTSTSFWVSETSEAGCEGPRSEVHVNVTAPPTLVITPSGATTFCAGSSVTLNGATGSDPSYANFSWSVSPSSGAGLSGTSGPSITVTPTVAGTYTITLTADDGNATTGCVNITSIVITMNANPVASNIVATPGSSCAGGTVTLTGQPQFMNVPVTGFNVDAVANGVGPVASSSTGDLDNVYTLAAIDWNYDGSCAALTNYMPVSGTIAANSSIASGLTYNLQSYTGLNTLRIPATGTGTTGTGTLTVTTPIKMNTIYLLYGAGNGPITSGITVTVTFTDATTQVFSNLTALDWFNIGGSHAIENLGRLNRSTAACQPTSTGGPRMFDMTLALSAVNQSKFVQSIKIDKTITTGIMNIWAVGMKGDPQIAGTINWNWNPGNLSGNPVTVNPTVTTTYTATATHATTGCSSTGTVTVTVAPVTANATATPSTPVCVGTSVTLNAGAVGSAPLTYSWASTPAGSYAASGSINVAPAVTTTYTVTVTDACLNTTTSSVTVTVNPLPTAGIQETGPITLCAPATQVLTATTDAGTATYQWTLNGTNITTGGTGPTYTVTGPSTGTYRVIVTNAGTNCVSAPSAGVVVTINPAQAAFNITPATATICNGGSVVLNTDATTSGTGTIGTGTGANSSTSSTSPYKGWYGGHKVQHMYKVAELTTMGITAGSSITAIAMTVSTFTGPYTFNGFTIAMKNTTASSLTGTPETGTTTVLPAATFTLTGTAPFVVSHTLTTAFTWDGTSNLVVEFCWNNNNGGGTSSNIGEVNYTTITGQATYFSADNNANVCTTASGWTASARRINMNFTYSKTPTITWSPTTGLSPTTGATVTASPSTTTTYTATATNNFGCSNTATTTVTVNPRPTATISGSGAYCQGQNTSTDLTVSFTGTAPWNYTYTDGTTPVSGTTSSNPLTITVSPGSASPALFTYEISALSDANCASVAGDLSGSGTVTINPLAASPTAVVSVQPTCAVGTGTITVTAPLGTGNSYTLDGTTTISWPTVSFTGVAPGPHTITVANSFGCSAPASTSVTVDPQPFIPGTPVVTGTVNVCPYIGTTTQLTYHATATGNGTQVFNWVIPTTNVTIVSGQGTADLVLTFQNGFAAQANKQLRLTVTNQCGTSSMTIYYLLAQFPNTPNPITGPTNVCALIGTATTATYTTNKAAGALTYNWSTPANTVVSHPNGAGTNDTTIVVTFNTGFTGGNISVVAENLCGPSGTRTLTIVNTPPSTPGLISGPTNGCPHVAPGGTAATYSIALVPFATSYNWTVTPATAVVTHPNGAGANDNTITVVFPAGFTSGTVTVSATNGCGTGGVRSLSVTKLNPATPSVIDVIQTHFCGEAGGRKYTYTLASMPANATSVLWTVPAGATFINLSAISIEVTYPDVAVNGFVTAQATSNCAVSTIRSTTVKLPACPPPGFAAGKGETINPGPITKAMEVKIFPNPTVSDFKLQVLTSGSEEITIRVMDNLGRVYKSFKMMPYQTIALGAELKAGSYMIEVRQGSEVKTSKLIKF